MIFFIIFDYSQSPHFLLIIISAYLNGGKITTKAYHLIGGGKLSGNSLLLAVNFASTIIPSMFLRFGTFFKA